MSGIQGINIGNSGTRQNIKKVLGCAVKNRRGNFRELSCGDIRNCKTIEQIRMFGLINTGHNLKEHTYKITDLGDEYYKEVFGSFNYWSERLSGIFKRFKNKLFKKEKI